MECRVELKKGSSDRPPFVAVEKKVFTKEQPQRSSFPLDRFRDDKRELSYSDFHREITKKVEDVCPKRLENRLKSRIGRSASGERDIVKYRSYVPSYVKKCEKLVEKKDVNVKAGGGDKQVDKHTRSSLSNTSTTSSLWTDESSNDSSRGLCVSPLRKRINNPPLQYYLMSSKPGDCSQDNNGDTSHNPRGTAFLQNEKKDTISKIVPKTKTFLSPLKPDSPSCTKVIPKKLEDDFKIKGEKLDERIRNPRVHAAVFVPGIVSQKQIIGLSKFYDTKVLLAERVAETNKKGFPVYGQSTVLDSDGSKPFLKRINFLSTEKNRSHSAPRSRKAETSSPSRGRALDRRSTEALPKQTDQKTTRDAPERARSISPFRRLSFSIGKSNKIVKDAQSPPQYPSTSSIDDSSSFDNNNTVNRGRSSPLRRLLDPLIRPKSSHACRSPEPSSIKVAPLSQPSSSTVLSRSGKSSTVQALFRVTSRNDQPLFTFAVDKEQSITAATRSKQIASEKEDNGHNKYTFFTVQEVQKKNGKWLNQGRKVQSQDYTSNIVAQMRVSGSKTPTGIISSLSNIVTREFVLFASESQRNNELAAMVIKVPGRDQKLVDPTDVNATVVLPSGIHSLPHKGGPSSLIQRWKSGGSCDCGGWDIGCNLRILTNQHNTSSPSTSDAFKLFVQGGLKDNNEQPFLSFAPYREGVYAVEYNSSSLSLLQAFSICIAVNEGRNLLKTVEPNGKAYGELKQRLKSYSGPIEAEAPAKLKPCSQPPLSPVGRV